MKTKKATETNSRLAGAGYLFLLKDRAEALDELQTSLLTEYEPLRPDNGAKLNLADPDSTHFYLVKKEGDERLDVHVRNLANVISVSLLSFTPGPVSDVWDGQPLLDRYEAALNSAGTDVLGSALLKFSGANTQLAKAFEETFGAPLADISANINGHILHQFVRRGRRQYFVIEGESATSMHDFVANELPQISWSVQRFQREWDFYNDRVKTILAEKEKIDNELSRVLHKKVGGGSRPDAAETLEDQIGRLASMYSILATDLHLIKEGSSTLEKDLVVLNRQSTAFSETGEDAWPHYHLTRFRDNLKSLLKHESDLRQSLENTKAAIDIAQTQAELLRGSQGLALQEKTKELLDQNIVLQDQIISLQVAAQVVELVIVFYYTLKSWEDVAAAGAVTALPSLVKFGVVATFSASVVALTHYIGTGLHERRLKGSPIFVTAALVALSLAAMTLLPGLFH